MELHLEIVLSDDETVFLDALATLLIQLGHHVVAATSGRTDLVDALAMYRPDVCVIDPYWSDGGGAEIIPELARVAPATKIVVLTSDRNPERLHRALADGAVGFVHKTRGVSVLLAALSRVVAGEIVIEGSFVRPNSVVQQRNSDMRRLAAYLTQREREILQLLVAGQDTVAMARSLRVSPTTIRTHVQAVLTKLGAHSRLEAALFAIRDGLVDPTAPALPPSFAAQA